LKTTISESTKKRYKLVRQLVLSLKVGQATQLELSKCNT